MKPMTTNRSGEQILGSTDRFGRGFAVWAESGEAMVTIHVKRPENFTVAFNIGLDGRVDGPHEERS